MTYSVADLSRLLDPHYRIERVVGVGGTAQVFLATDLRHARQVAIKVLHKEIAEALGPARFLREIAIAARLAHPNIVPLFDSGGSGTFLYYVMPFVEGSSLRDLLTRQIQLPVEDALRITREVADALAYAHALGIVHRDIKPENILLASGHAVVTDFGIAKAILAAGDERLTSGRIVIGTPAYMSPEQASADATLDGRSDVYSLATVLYEMLAGEVPFRGPTPHGLLGRKAEGHYPRLAIVRAAIPDALDGVIARALAPDPADRFQDVSAFAGALRASDFHAPMRAPGKARRLVPFLLLGLGATATVVTVLVLQNPPPSESKAQSGRLIVAPLQNRTGVKALDPVGVMAADWITSGLQRTGIIEVVPTPTAIVASRYALMDSGAAGRRDPLRTLADETGAALVIAGSYYQQAERLLFRVQVTDASGSRLLEALDDIAAPVTEPLRGIEELRARLMGWLAAHYDERIKAHLTRGERPPTYAAYVAFSEGMNHYILVENARGLPFFLRAFELDPSFVPALLYASLCLSNLGDLARSDSLLQIANRKRADLTDYDRAWLDYRLAMVAGNHEASLVAIRQAARLAPGSKAQYNHAVQAFQSGYVDEARSALEGLPPEKGAMRGFFPYWDMLGAVHHALGAYNREEEVAIIVRRRYPKMLIGFAPLVRARVARGDLIGMTAALREAEQVAADPRGWDYGDLLTEAAAELRWHGRPGDAASLFERAWNWYRSTDRGPQTGWKLTQLAYALGRWEETASMVDSLLKVDPQNVEYQGLRALVHGRVGERSQALAIADVLARDRRPYQLGAPGLYRARIAVVLGDRDAAVARLREAFRDGKEYDLWLHRDPDLLALRSYPPFEELVRTKH